MEEKPNSPNPAQEQQSVPVVDPSAYKDMPEAVRLIAAREDMLAAIDQIAATWGLSAPQILQTVEAALGEMRGQALRITTVQLAHSLAGLEATAAQETA